MISIIKVRQQWDRLIFIMGIITPVRWYLYTKMPLWFLKDDCFMDRTFGSWWERLLHGRAHPILKVAALRTGCAFHEAAFLGMSQTVHPEGWTNINVTNQTCVEYIGGILLKGPYLPCVSMAGRALLSGYHRYVGTAMLKPIQLPTVPRNHVPPPRDECHHLITHFSESIRTTKPGISTIFRPQVADKPSLSQGWYAFIHQDRPEFSWYKIFNWPVMGIEIQMKQLRVNP